MCRDSDELGNATNRHHRQAVVTGRPCLRSAVFSSLVTVRSCASRAEKQAGNLKGIEQKQHARTHTMSTYPACKQKSGLAASKCCTAAKAERHNTQERCGALTVNNLTTTQYEHHSTVHAEAIGTAKCNRHAYYRRNRTTLPTNAMQPAQPYG